MQKLKQVIMAYCLGGVFILSSVTKAIALPVFTDELELYLDIYFGGWLREYSLFSLPAWYVWRNCSSA